MRPTTDGSGYVTAWEGGAGATFPGLPLTGGADPTGKGYRVTGSSPTRRLVGPNGERIAAEVVAQPLPGTADVPSAASGISVTDAANDFAATNVETALAELQSDAETDAAALADHLGDATAAHAASAIGFTPAGTIAATTVQAAIEEVAAEAIGGSQRIKVVRAPLAFDTPGLITDGEDGGGVTIYTPTPGDVILDVSYVSITTAFDGQTPRLSIYSEGTGYSADAMVGMSVATANLDEVGIGPEDDPVVRQQVDQFGSRYIAASAGQNELLPTATPLIAVLDDSAGADPEATEGECEIVLVIVAAS